MATLETDTIAGPASYPTGGFVVTTGLASVNYFSLNIATPGANLPPGHFEYALNTPAAGQVTVKVVRHVYDRTSALGDVSGLPSGVTAAGASGQTLDTVSHLHSVAHDHAVVTTSTPTTDGGGVATAPGGDNMSQHTHTVNLPNFTGNTGSESAHTHTWNNIYQHQHVVSQTQTNEGTSELPNATDLSGATLTYLAVA